MSISDLNLAADNPVRMFRFRETVVTDIGRRRKENQDAYGIAHTDCASLYIVADGMGGARGGATASALAVNIISRRAVQYDGSITLSSLKTAIEEANQITFTRSCQDEELTGMGTTVVVLAITGDQVMVAHVGDSRIYRCRDGTLTQLTRDHTLVQELVETGAIPPEDAANHPIAHMLTRSLGPTDSVDVELRILPDSAAVGDRYLLCSDGLYNMVLDEEMAAELCKSSPEDAAKNLLALALDRGGTDNVSIEIVEICPLNDDSCTVIYPKPGEVMCKLSSRIDDIDLEEQIQEQNLSAVGQEEEQRPEAKSVDLSLSEDSLAEDAAEGFSLGISQQAKEEMPEFVAVEESYFDEEEGEEFGASGEEEPSDSKHPSPVLPPEGRGSQINPTILYSCYALVFSVVFFASYALYYHAFVRVPLEQTSLSAASPSPSPVQVASVRLVKKHQLKDEISRWTAENAENQSLGLDENSPPENAGIQVAAVSNKAAVSQEPGALEQPTEVAVLPKSDQTEGLPDKEVLPVSLGSSSSPALRSAPEAGQNEAEDYAIEQLKAQVNDLSIPPAPRVRIADSEAANMPASEPISWDSEAQRVGRLLVNPERIPVEHVEKRTRKRAMSEEDKLRSSEEIAKLVEGKNDIRNRIADIDAKLESLAMGTPQELQAKRTGLEAELKLVNEAIAKTSQVVDSLTQQLEMWNGFRQDAVDKNKLRLADRMADFEEQIRLKRNNYITASSRYLDAVDRWQQAPNDVFLASRMGSLGRVMQKKRSELEQGVVNAITQNIERIIKALSDAQLTLDNLKQHHSQLNRHLGYLEHPISMRAERKRELVRKYEQERELLTENLNELQLNLSDEREMGFRRTQHADALSVSPTER